MIDSLTDNYFVYSDHTIKPYFKMKKLKGNYIVLQHPVFSHFDPQNEQIYNERFAIEQTDNGLIKNFILNAEKYWNLKEDEHLWHQTGYWTIVDNNYQYFGLSESSLVKTIKEVLAGQFVFCLSSRDFVIMLKGLFDNGHIKNKAIIDIYCNNSFLPFVEIMDPFRKAIDELGKNKVVKKHKIPLSSIEIIPFHPLFDETSALSNVLIPKAITPIAKRILGPIVVVNNFDKFHVDILNEIEFIYAHIGGGVMKDDLFRYGEFIYRYNVIQFDDVFFVWGSIRPWESNGELIDFEEFEINTEFLDYFSSF